MVRKRHRLLAVFLSALMILGCVNPMGVFAEGEDVTYEPFRIASIGTGFGTEFWELYCRTSTKIPGTTDWRTVYQIDTIVDYGDGSGAKNYRVNATKTKAADEKEFTLCTSELKNTPPEGTLFTICAGQYTAKMDDVTYGIQIPSDYVYQYQGGQWVLEKATIDLTVALESGAPDTTMKIWNLVFDTSAELPGDIGTVYEGLSIQADGKTIDASFTKKENSKLQITFSDAECSVKPAFGLTLTVKAGKGTGSGLQQIVNITEDLKLEWDGSKLVEYAEGTSVVVTGLASTGYPNGLRIRVNVSPSLVNGFEMIEGLQVEMNLSPRNSTAFRDGGQLCFDLYDYQNQSPEKGTLITLKQGIGKGKDGNCCVKLAEECNIVYNGTKWEILAKESEEDTLPGDVNSDGIVSVKDLIRMKRYEADTQEVPLRAADMNSDSKLNPADVTLLRSTLTEKAKLSKNYYNLAGCPDYSDSQAVMPLGAYFGPRNAGTEVWNGNAVREHEVSYITDEGFKDYADAGLNYVMSEYDANYGSRTLPTYMELAEKYGIDVYVHSNTLTSLLRNRDELTTENKTWISNMIRDLQQYESFKGLQMADEPSLAQVPKFVKTAKYINQVAPNTGMFVSGFPSYGFATNKTEYPEYMKSLGSAMKGFTYDFYPFWRVLQPNAEGNVIEEPKSKWSMRGDWFYNLELAAQTAKGLYDTGITVQTHGANDNTKTSGGLYSHYRDIKKEEVSFQVYSALAYGMKRITYYTYWEHYAQSDETDFTSAMVMWEDPTDPKSKAVKTDTYYGVQAVNREILKFDHVFLNFNWQGTMEYKGADNDKVLAYRNSDYTSPRVASLTGTNDVIVGCLRDQNAYDGFMMVNATDPVDELTAEGTITFRDATHAIVYVHGEPTTVSLTNGAYHYNLASGEGIFVIPYLVDWKDSVVTHGRCVEQEDGSLGLFWTNSGVTFRFNGTGATAVIASSNTREGAQGYLNVYVDGSLEPTKTICLAQTEGTYVLAENLQAGEHTIEVRKRNEAAYGGSATITLKNITITGGEFLLYNKKSNYRIEVIGDSVTSGYGNMVTDGLGGYTSATTDGTKTYAVLAAKQLGAEVSIVSRSGIAYCRNLDSHDSMYNYYTKKATLPEGTCGNQDWDFQTNPSDVVVINLGSNDNVAMRDGIRVTDAYMTSEGVEFLKLVREKNPDAIIIWAYGMYEESRSKAIEAAVTQRNNEGDDKVYYLRLKQANKATEGIGAHLHPSIKTNIDRSITLAEFIAEKTGWSVQTQIRDYYKSQITN